MQREIDLGVGGFDHLFAGQSLDCCGHGGQDRKVSLSGTSTSATHTPGAAIAAALQWWRDAGVDYGFADEAISWLTVPEIKAPDAPAAYVPPKPAAPSPRPLIGGDPAHWPQDLDAFRAWWLTEPSLDGGLSVGRIAPRGTTGAALMVLVDQPEVEDGDALLSGPLGKLMSAIVSAMGIDPAEIYVASVLPRHMPHPDWADLASLGLPELTRHHLALAAPQRLICFGRHISSLLGHDPAKNPESLTTITHNHGAIPALMAPGLEDSMGRPRIKARLWQTLLDWQRG
jgi:DNA polymerase